MKIGLLIYQVNDRTTNSARSYDSIRAVAQQAEADGFDSIWLADHLLYRKPGEPTRGIWECWTMLSALAEATRRVDIGTLVLCNTFRNPAILAKMAVTADEVSNGRLILGIGAGWNEPEYQAFGLPFDHRVDRFEEAMQVLCPLLREGYVDFSGKYYQARDCELAPRGPRPDGPPLLSGGEGPRMLRLTARYADLWNTGYMGRPETMAKPMATIEAACQEVGRDPATLGITALIGLSFPDLPECRPGFFDNPLTATAAELAEAMAGYAELGVRHIMFQVEPYTPTALRRLTEAVQLYHATSRVLPGLAAAGEMGEGVDVTGLADVPGRGRERGVRPDPDHHPLLVPCHLLDLGQLGRRDIGTGHQVDHPAQHIDRLAEVILDDAIPVHLHIGERPLLVQHADAHLGIAPHRMRLRPVRHRRDEQVIVVHDVVNDGHRRAVVHAVVAEDAGAVAAYEVAAFGGVHWPILASTTGKVQDLAPLPPVKQDDPREGAQQRTLTSGRCELRCRMPASTVSSTSRARRCEACTKP